MRDAWLTDSFLQSSISLLPELPEHRVVLIFAQKTPLYLPGHLTSGAGRTGACGTAAGAGPGQSAGRAGPHGGGAAPTGARRGSGHPPAAPMARGAGGAGQRPQVLGAELRLAQGITKLVV